MSVNLPSETHHRTASKPGKGGDRWDRSRVSLGADRSCRSATQSMAAPYVGQLLDQQEYAEAQHRAVYAGYSPYPVAAVAMAYAPHPMHPMHPTLQLAPPPPDLTITRCWGAELKGDASQCFPGFQCGKVHFKNKFCASCRSGIDVPAIRIRPLSPELQIAFANSQSEGFWKTGPPHLGGGMLRIVNNTAACTGPWLAIYRGEPPPLAWGELPPKWVQHGYVRLCVAKGTLVPDLELRGKSLMRKRDGFIPMGPPAKTPRLDEAALRDAGSEDTSGRGDESASMLSMRRDAASSSHATLGPAAGARAGAPGPAGAPRPKGRRGFVLELSAAHRDLVSLLEGRLAEEDTAEGEREMLLAHLRLSKSVLRSVSDASGEAAGDGELAPGSEPNLTRLANVCAAMLDD